MCAHAWFDATRVFCFCTRGTHAAHTRVPFKLWVICTVRERRVLIDYRESEGDSMVGVDSVSKIGLMFI